MTEGYLLLNARNGAKLTRNLKWSFGENDGWLWSADEVEKILEIATTWEHQPVYYQHCRLVEEEDGDVNVYAVGEPEPL